MVTEKLNMFWLQVGRQGVGCTGQIAQHYYKYTVFTVMEALRAAVDKLETITSAGYWPYPSYTDLLFSVK